MSNRWEEREQAIMAGVLSLIENRDALETLRSQDGAALYESVVCKIRPTLMVCAGELKQMAGDLAAARRERALLRYAAETVIANQSDAPAENEFVLAALRAALPGHTFL